MFTQSRVPSRPILLTYLPSCATVAWSQTAIILLFRYKIWSTFVNYVDIRVYRREMRCSWYIGSTETNVQVKRIVSNFRLRHIFQEIKWCNLLEGNYSFRKRIISANEIILYHVQLHVIILFCILLFCNINHIRSVWASMIAEITTWFNRCSFYGDNLQLVHRLFLTFTATPRSLLIF